jgi:hypothetical protein
LEQKGFRVCNFHGTAEVFTFRKEEVSGRLEWEEVLEKVRRPQQEAAPLGARRAAHEEEERNRLPHDAR